MATGGIALPIGLALLATGATSSGVTNNIWTNKFKPRNGDLGIERTELDLQKTVEEVGKRRIEKKLLKNYANKHLTKKPLKYLAGSLVSTLPFLQEKGANMRHDANLQRIDTSNSRDKDRLDLLERMINIRKILDTNSTDKQHLLDKHINFEEISEQEKRTNNLFSLDKDKTTMQQILGACQELNIDASVLNKFIQNSIIVSQHDTSINDVNNFKEKLEENDL